ncbi:hypothetical protein Z517_01296 [Fonsecaea pedrosoi CBS 271.37]|uniref:FAD-binding FR-type domain-containing protein n=1 Tax=Fonsecaea pedrosoi CBS 271.37 TaxID=1442368 RepID=A0A0D2GXV1_9EURO|nr:uncharacterized protein Z517_01296 [Fonsecaea pedrosoi CBS 271.37]KIW85903.1 hypothetical protein Z517_01296 [Fonsecaea pedrosoi CBS 271.37]
MKTLNTGLLLCGLALGAAAGKKDCVDGIRTALDYLAFNITDTDYYIKSCTNKLVVTSMWATAKLLCTPEQITAGEVYYEPYCVEYGGVQLVHYDEVAPMLTDEYIKSLPVAQYSDVEALTIFDTPVVVSKTFWKIAKDTTTIFDLEYILHERYGWSMYGFWGGLLLIGMINRLITHVSQSRRLKAKDDVEGGEASSSEKKSRSGPVAWVQSAHHWLRAQIIIPATFGSHHNRPLLWSTIPTRMETIVLVSFYIMTFILCCVGYYITSPNLYYTKSQQAWRYISDRTGIISYAMLPWLWLFAGRNNIFLWLTGWSFSTFNIFHRHIARAATILAIVHSVGWSVLEGGFGYFSESWHEQYWYMGGMATITMSLLLLFSFMWFRVRSYEIFLLIHIGLSIATIIGLFYHTKIFDGEYDGYLWPLVAIWCFDRGARLVRWAYCNLHLKWSHAVVSSLASATYDKDGDFIRLEIVPGSGILKPGPGQHYYLYQPMKWRGWENHPFTLASYETVKESTPPGVVTVHPGAGHDVETLAAAKDIEVSATGSSSPTSSNATPDPSQHRLAVFKEKVGSQKLTFLIRPFGSWTKRLREECLKSPTGVITPHIFIEGPYGEHSALHTYENVILVVGGTGIAGAIPYLQDHITRASNNAQASRNGGKLATRTRDITLIWATRQSAMLRNVVEHELKPMFDREDIHIHLYATSAKQVRSASPDDSDDGRPMTESKELDLKSTPATSISDKLSISRGRPDISATIRTIINDVNSAGSAGGRIAILTCGPGGMADEARAAVHSSLKEGKRGVEYFEESFG